MADTVGRCRGVTIRALGSPLVLELFADGEGHWAGMDGAAIRELEGAVDVDLGITAVTHALALPRRMLSVGESATTVVACIDVLGSEVCRGNRQYIRDSDTTNRVSDAISGASRVLRLDASGWMIEGSA